MGSEQIEGNFQIYEPVKGVRTEINWIDTNWSKKKEDVDFLNYRGSFMGDRYTLSMNSGQNWTTEPAPHLHKKKI